MRRTSVSVGRLLLSPSGNAALHLALPAPALPAPGQILLACHPDREEALRHALLPVHVDSTGLVVLQPEGVSWQPGDPLDVLGPIGHGFKPAVSRRRWLLMALGIGPDVLWPLMEMGLERGISLTMWADTPLPTLPPQVEIPSVLDQALEWADFVGIALTAGSLESPGAHAALLGAARRPGLAEAMVILPMPCGTGVCGACLVGRGHASQRACVAGPVFALEDLIR